MSSALNLDLSEFLLLHRAGNRFTPPFYNIKGLEHFSLETGFSVSPLLHYDAEEKNAEILNSSSTIRLQYRVAPSLVFLMERRQADRKSAYQWQTEEEVKMRYDETEYPLGVNYLLSAESMGRPSWIQFQGFLNDYKDEEWNILLGAGDSTLFKFQLSFYYGFNQWKENAVVRMPALLEANPTELLVFSRVRFWQYHYQAEPGPLKFLTYYRLALSRQPGRDSENWLNDSTRNQRLGLKLEYRRRPLKGLFLAWEGSRSQGATRGFHDSRASSTPRFHYAPIRAVGHQWSAGKYWEIRDDHRLSAGVEYFNYRFKSRPLPWAEASRQNLETFNYYRFNQDWFNIYFIGLNASKSEMIDGNFRLTSLLFNPGYEWRNKGTCLKVRIPVNFLQCKGDATMTSRETIISSETQSGALKGRALLATPQLYAETQVNLFSFQIFCSYALPAYLRFSLDDSEILQEEIFQEKGGSQSRGATWWRTGLYFSGAVRLDI